MSKFASAVQKVFYDIGKVLTILKSVKRVKTAGRIWLISSSTNTQKGDKWNRPNQSPTKAQTRVQAQGQAHPSPNPHHNTPHYITPPHIPTPYQYTPPHHVFRRTRPSWFPRLSFQWQKKWKQSGRWCLKFSSFASGPTLWIFVDYYFNDKISRQSGG